MDEVATLYILDDPDYFVALSGTAAIKILDDDLAGQPTVSIATVTPTVPENGMDRGTFLARAPATYKIRSRCFIPWAARRQVGQITVRCRAWRSFRPERRPC